VLEKVGYLIENIWIRGRSHKGDGQTLGSKATSSTHLVQYASGDQLVEGKTHIEPKPDTLSSLIFHLLSRQRWKETLLTSIINILRNQFGFIYVVLGSTLRSDTYPMQISISRVRHVIINDNVDTFNVNASSNKVGGHQNSLVSLLKTFVPRQPEHAQVDDQILSSTGWHEQQWHCLLFSLKLYRSHRAIWKINRQ
jgi:hypothetical protein